MKKGCWWNDKSIEVVEVDGDAYALYGWNGEKFTECWQCTDEKNGVFFDAVGTETYTLRPVYRFEEEGIDLSTLEEDSDEWESAVAIVDYDVALN